MSLSRSCTGKWTSESDPDSAIHLEDAADPKAAGAGPVRAAPDLRALVGGEAGPVVTGAARALRVLELDPGDQVEKLGGENISK